MSTFIALILAAKVAFAQAEASTPTPAETAAPAEAAPAEAAAPAETAAPAEAATPAETATPAGTVPTNEVEAVGQVKSAVSAFQAGQIALGISLILGVILFIASKFVKKP